MVGLALPALGAGAGASQGGSLRGAARRAGCAGCAPCTACRPRRAPPRCAPRYPTISAPPCAEPAACRPNSPPPAGDVFPIHGTCLGFQLLHILEANVSFTELLVDTDSGGARQGRPPPPPCPLGFMLMYHCRGRGLSSGLLLAGFDTAGGACGARRALPARRRWAVL